MLIFEKSFDDVAAAGRLDLDRLLKRYTSERRRRKMTPYYERALADAAALAAPRAVADVFAVNEVDALGAWLPADTAAVGLGVCTLGPTVDERARELTQTDYAAAAVFEEVLLTVLVGFTNLIHRHIRAAQAGLGRKAGPAYRPGVGRWPIETQSILFDKIPAAQIGVALSAELVMTPLQSTSLIIPLRRI